MRNPCEQSQANPEFLLACEHAKAAGLKPRICYRNLAVPQLYEMALKHEHDTALVSSGALAASSGEKTGRSPKDKRVMREPQTEKEVWWGQGSPNFPMDERAFLLNRARAVDYLNFIDAIFVFDGYANWDVEARTKIRVVCARPYHALFMHNMLIRPTPEELKDFGEPDFVIYNSGPFPANRYTSYMTSSTSVDLSLTHRELVILGTSYAGEMKKGVFTIMHYLMPKRNILSLHSGCNIGKAGDVTLFFGLSGTGKTTLSTDGARPLIGDDEHCWGSKGVFNIEGGCYAKTIGLQEAKEPEIYKAIRFGAILENVVFDRRTRVVDFNSGAITENTRASYPIDFIDNACIPCVGPHPKNVILLCCDAFGVLPPVSHLSLEQAMYMFVSGYTAKIAGTEMGVKEPEATFSACFGAAFLMWHPMKYAAMLAERMQAHGTTAWLINTGWTGGGFGVGTRMSLPHTRAIVDAIHSGDLAEAEMTTTPIFNLSIPTACPGVPSTVLQPELSWPDRAKFHDTLEHLAKLFMQNFSTFLDGDRYVGPEMAARMIAGGPQLSSFAK
ncbi:phosphoenolpyruvate carboxykinase, splice variant [Dunaliella salina]|uniref:phosphoenolpyruvate carboxykinase (ATP) n=1 Tax=Dunaliella salina TaxID=3046 RepID=A0ABQ7FZS2_DUNSA|nr:phosphoenolpyruvate carboxykinase, splice variant [Dunaliella salina]|eukprot:KAF5827858.1 phosphoenolpyruvate carboxykinase, splice variant [Dunaliella salina]